MLSLVTSIRAKDELFSLCNGMVARGDAVPAVRVRGITRKCSGRFANPQATPMLAARWSDTTWRKTRAMTVRRNSWLPVAGGPGAWNVYMVKKFGYPISGISDHAESYRAGYGSNHGDVGQWWPKHGKSMDALRKEVQEILNGETEDDDMDVARFKELWGEMRKELQDNDASAYSAEAREWATKNGLIAGNGTTVSGEPNCMWGDILTREQFVTVLYRWTQMMGKA